ncbi:hypothetical protein BC937DRAFT_94739 [Endogone sp. FLAS-F59071]|nr:hypothetical protein BC937DRAFT_94739 [Endogone sp. FLAS-F59071]|eukprot:RUS20631.1 hypothetical protein BC937DRAFT_94739 [Endogone sp. FLAS-F59071]
MQRFGRFIAPVLFKSLKPTTIRSSMSMSISSASSSVTAACVIIGDEILNGKTKDSNSNFLVEKLWSYMDIL